MTTLHHPLLRRALLAVAIATLAIGSAACQPRPATASQRAAAAGSGESAQMVAMINNFRGANGLPGVATAGDATYKAQAHANEMAAAGAIFHSSNLASSIQPGWRGIGENVAVAYSLSQAESSLEASAPHRTTMLNGLYNQVGVGVAHGANGAVYVAEVFVGR